MTANQSKWSPGQRVWWWTWTARGRKVGGMRREGYIVSVGPTEAVCRTNRGTVNYTVLLSGLNALDY